MKCDDVQEQLALNSGITDHLAAHLASCAECRNAADDFASLNGLLAALPAGQAPDSMWEKVGRAAHHRRSLRPLLVAVLIVILATLVMLYPRGDASAAYARMRRTAEAVSSTHLVIYSTGVHPSGSPAPGEATQWEVTENWVQNGWLRREGLHGKHLLRGHWKQFTWFPEVGHLASGKAPREEVSTYASVDPGPRDDEQDSPQGLGSVVVEGKTLNVLEYYWQKDSPTSAHRFRIWVDDSTNLPVRLEINHKSGDAWLPQEVILFTFNTPLPGDLFKPENLQRTYSATPQGPPPPSLPLP